ncbi:MAG TPA: BON domain-containing protein [Acidobacteriaceae bacterium]|nr:BON domain-containing protein [Acidobacteriaceae bacterium]
MSLKGFSRISHPILVGSFVVGTAAFAQNQPTQGNMPDAQIEANVLRALASAPELSTQNIQSATVYGTVTLTGNVHDEAMRTKAENLVARAVGVKKVVDELALGDSPATSDQAAVDQSGDQSAQAAQQPPAGGQLQSDGSYAPAQPPSEQAENTAPPMPNQQQPDYNQQQPQPPNGTQQAPDGSQYPGGYGPPQNQPQAPYGPPQANQQYPGGYGPPQGQPQQQPYGAPQANQQYPGGYGPPQDQGQAQPYPGQPQQYSGQAQQYPGQAQQYPGQQQPYQGQPQPYGPPPRRPLYNNGPDQAYAPPGGQQAGLSVTIPEGAMLRIRINRGLDSNHIKPGTPFDGTVINDVAADGAIAIPRGASVQGTVVDATKAGTLSGRGELSLAINSVTLAGVSYPLETKLWEQHGRDKSTTTANSALGLGALGAILGGIAGGGTGAAVGAVAGAGVGVAGSASSPSGRVIVPPEAVITFQLAQPAVVKTVSEQEMARLAYAAGANPQQPPMRRYYSPYYGYYYAPYYGR